MVHERIDAGERVIVRDNLSTGFDWAVAKDVPLTIGDTGDQNLVNQIIRQHKVDSIIHFAASAIVPESVKDPLNLPDEVVSVCRRHDIAEHDAGAALQKPR